MRNRHRLNAFWMVCKPERVANPDGVGITDLIYSRVFNGLLPGVPSYSNCPELSIQTHQVRSWFTQ
jgi:hypothetical protein